jgi:hypothetical protein
MKRKIADNIHRRTGSIARSGRRRDTARAWTYITIVCITTGPG